MMRSCNWQLVNWRWFDLVVWFQWDQHAAGSKFYQKVSSYTVWHVNNIVLLSRAGSYSLRDAHIMISEAFRCPHLVLSLSLVDNTYI